MTPKQTKLAYILLFSFFALWLALILAAFFSSGNWTTAIVFNNRFMLTLFGAAAVLSSVSSMLLGLEFLGFNFWLRKPKPEKVLVSNGTQAFKRRKGKSVSRRPSEEVEDNVKVMGVGSEQLLIGQNVETAAVTTVNLEANQREDVRSKDRLKAFYLFGETDFDRCSREFGYLGEMGKNKPIPDDCFGCPKIIECMKTSQK